MSEDNDNPKFYRRPLAPDQTNTQLPLESNSQKISPLMIIGGIIAIVFCLFFLVKQHGSGSNALASVLAQEKQSGGVIYVVTMAGSGGKYFSDQAITLLHIYGLKTSTDSFSSSDDLHKLLPGLKEDEEAKMIYFILGNGQVVTSIYDFYTALTKLPIIDFNPDKKSPYVILYASSSCRPSQALAENKLRALGIPYELVEVQGNESVIMPLVSARLIASGKKDLIPKGMNLSKEIDFPLIETNNHIFLYTEADKFFKNR